MSTKSPLDKGENFLALCARVKGIMFFENELYEEMVKETKDEEIYSNDSSSEKWLSLMKRLKLQEWIYESDKQVYIDMRNLVVNFMRSKQTNSTSTLSPSTSTLPRPSTTKGKNKEKARGKGNKRTTALKKRLRTRMPTGHTSLRTHVYGRQQQMWNNLCLYASFAENITALHAGVHHNLSHRI